MANQEHLDVLKQGVRAWNQWREKHLETRPDLSVTHLGGFDLFRVDFGHALLRGANLSHMNLKDSHFSNADLFSADLSNSCLRNAYLIEADLTEADLHDAYLTGAYLTGTYLLDADLTGAHLSETHLSHAHMSHANLTDADFREANLQWTDLRGSNLNHTDFRNAKLFLSDLTNATLCYANFRHASLNSTTLHGVCLNDADLSSAELHSIKLTNALLRRTLLRETHFSDANLRGADLSEANLTNAILNGADLSNANFTNAVLRGGVFNGADLSNANFMNAILNSADLSNANLTNAILNGADLANTNFTNATIGWTSFGDRDLRMLQGLDTLVHVGPSPLSISTIYLSQGQIPVSFLQGAGISENFIEYMDSLVNRAITYHTCFISYSNKDQAFAQRLYTDLQSMGVRCWFAPEDLKIGDHYHQRIDESIRLYDKLILILSEHAVQSAWVEREVVAAREKEDRALRPMLFPLRVDDAVMDTTKAWAADVRRRWHIGDFTQWKHHDAYQQAFERLIHDLKAGEKA